MHALFPFDSQDYTGLPSDSMPLARKVVEAAQPTKPDAPAGGSKAAPAIEKEVSEALSQTESDSKQHKAALRPSAPPVIPTSPQPGAFAGLSSSLLTFFRTPLLS